MPEDSDRPLGVWTAVFLGLNAIVGSGIYLFPGTLARDLGPASVVAFGVTALVCLPIAFAYAELARDHDRSGGTYRYVVAAFGPYAGAVVGWISWISAVVSWAAVANGVPGYLGHFVPALGPGVGGKIAAAVLVVVLTALNWRGVRLGAWVSNGFTIGKLLPLALLAAAGATAWIGHGDRLVPFAPHGYGALPGAVFLVLFAYEGFEVVGIAAGEMKEARRSVPRGVLLSIGLSAVLYCTVQLGYLAAGSPRGDAPLASAARVLFGGLGATLLGIGGLVSIVGFTAGSAFGSPRYLFALAEDGHLPRSLSARHAVHGTPALSILWTGAATLLCTVGLGFERLVAIANVSVLLQYAATAVALVSVRRTPKWIAVGLGAGALCVLMMTQAEPADLAGLAVVFAIFAIGLAVLRRRAK